MKEYFSEREGTEINENGLSKIKRSDGKLTYVPENFWKEGVSINPQQLYLDLASKSKIYFLELFMTPLW